MRQESEQRLNEVGNALVSLFAKKDKVAYSLGFQRMQKLSRKQRVAAFTSLYFQGFTETLDNHNELKRRLANMTATEYKAYKQA